MHAKRFAKILLQSSTFDNRVTFHPRIIGFILFTKLYEILHSDRSLNK
jgi:hypothetical protein